MSARRAGTWSAVVSSTPCRWARCLSGMAGTSDLSIPVNRVALDASLVNSRRPFPTLAGVNDWSFEGVSNYNSMQVTLSRQTGRRLQYFAAYTLARSKGTTSGNGEYGNIDPFDPSRTYGVLPEDRTHIFNLSWNAFLPDGARGGARQPGDARCAQRLAVVRDLDAGQRRAGVPRLRRTGVRRHRHSGHLRDAGRHRQPGPGRRRPRRSLAGLHVRPASGWQQRRREAVRHQLHRHPGVRGERRPDSAVQPADADTHQPRPDGLQELRHPRRPEDPVPCRVLQPVQPGVGHHQLGGRHRPGAEHDLQRQPQRRAQRRRWHCPTTSATRRRASATTRTRSTTSGRST